MLELTQREIHLARVLLRTLIFEPMPILVGQRLEASSVEDLLNATDLLRLANLKGQLTNERKQIELTLAKYGFADLQFALSRGPSGLKPARAKVLARLMGDPRSADASDEELEVRIGYLEDLREEVQAGKMELTVRCDGESARLPLADRMRATRGFRELPEAFFPQAFVVSDAYVTNAPTVGVLRNFYL